MPVNSVENNSNLERPATAIKKGEDVIYFKEQYIEFIRNRGVGAKDRVASSPKSYVSYLHSVSEILSQDITPAMLRSEQDIKDIVLKIGKQRAPNTVRNYCSAMRQYVAFVEEKRL